MKKVKKTDMLPEISGPQKTCMACRNGSNSAPTSEVLGVATQRKKIMLRMKALQARIGLGRSSIYALISGPRADPDFPRPIKLSAGRAVGFLEESVDAYLELRVQKSVQQRGAI